MEKRIITLFIFIVAGINSYAQFEVSGVIRPRMEYRNGYAKLRDSLTEAAFFVSQRTRLNIGFENDKIETYISFYDFRVWGDQPLKKDIASVGLSAGWAEVSLTENFSVKFGRQSFKYDNSRLLSPVNWNQIGAAHDAILFKYRNSGWQIDLASAFNQSVLNNFGTDYADLITNYKTLNFLWINKIFGKTEIAFLGIVDGYQKKETTNTIYMRYTPGLIAKYKNSLFKIAARGFYQGGKNQAGDDISAFYLNTDIGIKIFEKLNLVAGFEIMSGNNLQDSLSKTDRAFNILYGARHKFNGNMDYFSVPITTDAAGLINPYLKLNFQINEIVALQASYHYFRLYGDYVYNNGFANKFLGNEIDLNTSIKFFKYFKLDAGYSAIFATKTLSYIKGGNNRKFNSWAFLMITVDPVLFRSK